MVEVVNVVIDSVIIGIMVFVFNPAVFITNIRWNSWNLQHWLLRYKLPWFDQNDTTKKLIINSRVSIYACLQSLQLFVIMRSIAYVVSLVDFIVNPDISNLYLKAAVMLTKDLGIFMSYIPLLFLAFVWLGVCSPVLRNDGGSDGKLTSNFAIGRWFQKVVIERKDLFLKLFVVYPLFIVTMGLLVSSLALGIVLGFIMPVISYPTYQDIRNNSYFFMMLAADITMVAMFIVLGLALALIVYSSIQAKQRARVPSSQLTRQKSTIIRVSVVVLILVFVTVCRLVGTLARLTSLKFWIYNLLQSTLVESLVVIAILFLFSNFNFDCGCLPWLDLFFKPLQTIQTLDRAMAGKKGEKGEEKPDDPSDLEIGDHQNNDNNDKINDSNNEVEPVSATTTPESVEHTSEEQP